MSSRWEGGSDKGILYPPIYVLVTEALHLMLHEALAFGLIHGFHVEHSGLEITHLKYADDTILFLNSEVGS